MSSQSDNSLDISLGPIRQLPEGNLARLLIHIDVLEIRLAAGSESALHESTALLGGYIRALEETRWISDG